MTQAAQINFLVKHASDAMAILTCWKNERVGRDWSLTFSSDEPHPLVPDPTLVIALKDRTYKHVSMCKYLTLQMIEHTDIDIVAFTVDHMIQEMKGQPR